MKTNTKKNTTPMVAHQEQPRINAFRVNKPDDAATDADQLSQEVSSEEANLATLLAELTKRQTDLADKKAQAAEASRIEKLELRAGLLDDAADWREIAKTSTDAGRAKDFLRRAKEAETEAARLGAELNLTEAATGTLAVIRPLKALSTNKALWLIVGLFIVFVGLTRWVGADMLNDPENPTGQSIMSNAPIRAVLSFTLTFLTFLTACFFIRVAFPQFYRIWHNRIDSERSLDDLLNESPAWVVLACLLGLFYMFMQLFASYYQAIFA